ncbi:MAG: hypothetical protein AAFP97_11005 [Pseudomonadota bacterium]
MGGLAKVKRFGPAIAAIVLSGCATVPTAEEICTPQWIEPRVDRAVDRIETRLDKTLDALTDAGDSWLRGRSPGPIQLLRLSNAAKELEREIEDGQGINDLRLIASTCNDPDLIETQIYALLNRQGISSQMTSFLEETGMMRRIIEVAEGELRTDANS